MKKENKAGGDKVKRFQRQTYPSVLEKLYQRFLKIRGSPREIALGFAMGLFLGFTPSMGLQIVAAVFIASILKWSKIAAAIGVQVTNPLSAPLVYSATFFIGSKIIGLDAQLKVSDLMSFDGVSAVIGNAPDIFAALFIGGIAVGVPLAFIGYIIVYQMMDRYQEKLKAGILKGSQKVRQKIKRRQ